MTVTVPEIQPAKKKDEVMPRPEDSAAALATATPAKESIAPLPAQPASPEAQDKQAQPTLMPEQKFKPTPGYRLFDFLNYYAVGWLVNAGISVVIAESLNHGRLSQPFKKLSNGISKTFFERSSKDIGATREKVLGHMKQQSLTVGGLSLLVPMKLAENNRTGITKWLDRTFFGLKPESDPELQKNYEMLEQQPTTSWTTLLLGRVGAVLTVGSTHWFLGTREAPLPKAMGTRGFTEASIDMAQRFDAKVHANNPAQLRAIEQAKTTGDNTRFTRLTDLGILDIAYSFISASVQLTATKIGKLFDEKSSLPQRPESPVPEKIKHHFSPIVAAPYVPKKHNDNDKPRTQVAQVSRDAVLESLGNEALARA